MSYADSPKLDFAVFKNKYAKTDKHPSEVGKIEFSREFLKAMVERAKTGQMPVLRVAMWERLEGWDALQELQAGVGSAQV